MSLAVAPVTVSADLTLRPLARVGRRRGAGRRLLRDHGAIKTPCKAFPERASYGAAIQKEAIAVKTPKNAILTALTLSVLALASPAAALEPLAQEKYINDRLVAARIADRIRRECPTLNGRTIYAFQQARGLKAYARKKGYSAAQIDAFLDDKTQRKRIYAIAEDYMARNGVKPGNADSFCALGRQEIANGTVTGSLLVPR